MWAGEQTFDVRSKVKFKTAQFLQNKVSRNTNAPHLVCGCSEQSEGEVPGESIHRSPPGSGQSSRTCRSSPVAATPFLQPGAVGSSHGCSLQAPHAAPVLPCSQHPPSHAPCMKQLSLCSRVSSEPAALGSGDGAAPLR